MDPVFPSSANLLLQVVGLSSEKEVMPTFIVLKCSVVEEMGPLVVIRQFMLVNQQRKEVGRFLEMVEIPSVLALIRTHNQDMEKWRESQKSRLTNDSQLVVFHFLAT